jgi:hypothetical protein
MISPPLLSVDVDINTEVSLDDSVLWTAADCEPPSDRASFATDVDAVLLLFEECETEVDVEAAPGVGRRVRWLWKRLRRVGGILECICAIATVCDVSCARGDALLTDSSVVVSTAKGYVLNWRSEYRRDS